MTGGPGPHGLSDEAQAFVAGVLEGLPALPAGRRAERGQLPATHRSALVGALLLLPAVPVARGAGRKDASERIGAR